MIVKRHTTVELYIYMALLLPVLFLCNTRLFTARGRQYLIGVVGAFIFFS